MTAGNQALRALIIYGICLPLAVILGYIMATGFMPWESGGNFAVSLLITIILLAPILLRWHHDLLIFSWNMTAVVFFVPGRPNLWMALVVVSLAITLGRRALMAGVRLTNVPSIAWPLAFLAVVVGITAMARGIGFGITDSGISGGKRYLTLFMAMVGYYALSFQRIPPKYAGWLTGLYFLGGATMAIGSLFPYVDPFLYFIFYVFPLDKAAPVLGSTDMAAVDRVFGLGFVAPALVGFMLARYGVRGILVSRAWWRFPVFMACVAAGMFGGYRSLLILILLTFGIMFYLEGLHRSKALPVMVLIFLGGALVMLPFARQLPTSFQRTMAFLPIEVDPVVKLDADTTAEWRLRMWKTLINDPDNLQYLMLGRGLSIDSDDLSMAFYKARATHGMKDEESDYRVALLSGDFHNGLLTVLILFGVWGLFGFGWLMVAGIRLLVRNCRYGDPEMLTVNRLLLASFIAQLLLYVFIFGSFHQDLQKFVGILGLSVALNGGMAKPAPAPAQSPVRPAARLAPLLRPVRPALGR